MNPFLRYAITQANGEIGRPLCALLDKGKYATLADAYPLINVLLCKILGTDRGNVAFVQVKFALAKFA